MRLGRLFARSVAILAIAGLHPGKAGAQVSVGPASHPIPYAYPLVGGPAAPRPHPPVRRPATTGGPQTVTDYQSLINAITALPGWHGRPAHPAPPIRPRPTVARGELLLDDGTVRWPTATPTDAAVSPAKKAAEEAVRLVVDEHRKYGRASSRHVTDARNKLRAFAGRTLPALKSRNAAAADGLERFIVELQKTLATLTDRY